MRARHRRPVAAPIAAAVVATACSVTLAPPAQATSAVADAPRVAAGAATVTDADARQGAIAAVVRDAEGRPHLVEVTAPTVAEAKRKAAAVPGAEAVTVDAPVRISAAEPYRAQQWGHGKLQYDALPVTVNSGNVVAILDTGVRASHEDFAAGQVLCVDGSDLVDGDPAADACVDPHGHGTHVAGIVAASVNGKGISGIAPGTSILPVRVLGADGSGSAHRVAEGIVWAADQGATVINASLGSTSYVQALDEAVAYATGKGALVVAAAGNNRLTGNAVNWPAASPGALSVASTTSAGVASDFSYEGPSVDIAAPGSGILSLGVADDSTYVFSNGTSMASPYVAGVASLVQAQHRSWTPGELTTALVASATDMQTAGRDDRTGAGLVDPLELLTGEQPPAEQLYVAPTAPTGVDADAGDATVSVSWAAVASTAQAPVSEYRVFRDGALVMTTTRTALSDTSLVNGRTYSYEVTAVGTGGQSARSGAVTATPAAQVAAPAAPQGLQATGGDAQVRLSWSAVASTQAAPVASYRVYREGVAAPVATVTTPSYVDAQVVNGTTYRYAVAAVGAGGESARSGAASATPVAPAPVAPAPVAPAPAPAPTDGGSGGSAPVPPAPAAPQPGAPAPVVAPPAPPVLAPAPVRVVAPAKAVLRPLPTRVARGQRVPVVGRDYRPASVLTVTQTYQVRQRVAVRQPVTRLVVRRVTVKGAAVTRKVPVVTGYRTVRVDRLVTRTARLGHLRIAADGSVVGAVLPVRGVAGGVLTVSGVDRRGKPVVVRSALRVG